ncbi:coxsackievirus and adenovirus receptor-like isoform X2 [Simochromis diagramma]|uniref:coxsackievirus and adenovirus receptor-like isoform X2 n=1 Tax=Simochromis diagramma TaxID=43689 RepID=UPI001A7EE37D|nr:coxsackievirus and adenovirus receptor-like isoform X2 [Simochromis diagramma]
MSQRNHYIKFQRFSYDALYGRPTVQPTKRHFNATSLRHIGSVEFERVAERQNFQHCLNLKFNLVQSSVNLKVYYALKKTNRLRLLEQTKSQISRNKNTEMSPVTTSLCSTLLFVGVFVFVPADKKTITAESGQSITLPCRAPNNNILAVEWSRANLGDEYVLLYRDGRFEPDEQHPSFKNRVDLQDRQMKDGDVSLILNNVTTNDTGTYECRVKTGNNRRKRANLSGDPISIINLHVVVPPDQKIITAKPGQNVMLPCRAPNNSSSITGVEWSRADLQDEYVLLYRDDLFDPDNQHPSFKNRVDLQDRQMKDGDVSLILKNVMINDNGIYECQVFTRGTNMRKRANLVNEPISIIYLSVVPPGQTGGDTEDGSVGLIVGLIVPAVLLVAAVVGLLIFRKHKQQHSQDSYQPPAELQPL